MKAPTISRRIWLVASTVAVIGGLFAYYFFVYMEARQKELEAKKFRALHQYAENIKGAYAERTKRLLEDRYICTSKDTVRLIPKSDVEQALSAIGLSPSDKIKELLENSPECIPSNEISWAFGKDLRAHRRKVLDALDIPDCISPDTLKKERLELLNGVVKQSEFTELVIEVDSLIERQTFANSIDETVLQSILKKDNAVTKRQVEFQINNEDYIAFIHSFNLPKNKARIFGFCSKNEFNSQVRSIDLVYVIGTALLLILILLTMPLLKLWIMNEQERLQSVNVWFCGFSLVVGSSFLFLILLMANDLFTTYDSIEKVDLAENRNQRVKALSDSIENKFVDELRSIFKETEESGIYYEYLKGERTNTKMFEKALKNPWLKFGAYPYFNEILWINRDGTQDLIMANHELLPGDVVNLRRRKYFSEPKNDSTWMLPDSEGDKRFALQSIHSYTTNLHEAGFGTRFRMADGFVGVLAIATKLHSVMDPLLPPGYQFAIIDKTGKVWFHSITDRNLNENLFDETGRDAELIAAVQGRTAVTINVKYDRTSHHAYVKPIRDIELFIVVLHDDSYFSTPIVLTVGFAFTLVFALFLIQGIHQLILIVSTNRFSLLKVRQFFLAWMGPQTEKLKIYRTGVWIQLLLLTPTLAYALFARSMSIVVCFMTLPVMLTVYHYFSLEHDYILAMQNEKGRWPWLHPFLIMSTLLVLLVNFSSIYVFGWNASVSPLIIQTVILSTLLVAYCLRIRLHQPFMNTLVTTVDSHRVFVALKGYFIKRRAALEGALLLKQFIRLPRSFMKFIWLKVLSSPTVERLKSLETSYYAFVFLWLILASIIPTYFFYRIGYYEESKIWTRYLEFNAAQRQESRDIMLQNELGENFEGRVNEMSAMGNYLPKTREVLVPDTSLILENTDSTLSILHDLHVTSDTLAYQAAKESTIHRLMFNGTPRLKGYAEQSRSMIFPRAGDGQWQTYEHGLASCLKYKTNKGEIRYYQSDVIPYRLLKGDYRILVLVVIVLSVLMLYKTLRFCVTHIFGLELLKGTDKSPSLNASNYLFIVGLPHSGKDLLAKLKQVRKICDNEAQEIDLNVAPAKLGVNCKLVVANYFHLNINSHESNQKKLENLEAFNKRDDLIVVVISNLEPSAILEFYEKMSNYYRGEKGDYEIEGNFRKCKQAYRKWKHILGQYTTYYHALKQERQFRDEDINLELDHGEYLPKLYKYGLKQGDTTRERENMILEVENLSQLYYQSVWNCLSSSEKFILHDLAKDGFVNMRNMKVIRTLRQKGVLTVSNSLQIMNKSFNNFILSVVEEDADIKFEDDRRKQGSWNTVHLILVITIVSIIAFLGIAQQNLFKSFEAIIATTGALLPLLARFGGIFTGSKAKE